MRSTATSRIAASGGTFDARQAGMTRREHRDPMPTTNDDHDRRRLDHEAAGGDVEAEAGEHALQESGHAEADEEAEHRRHHPDHERFDQHRPHHLAAPAPTARSNAISRVRWATRIENVL